MWQDDEDNNPYGSFNPDSTNPVLDTSYHDQQTSSPPSQSPENEPPEFLSHPRDLSDDEEAEYSKSQTQSYLRKQGAYDSRIQQLLYENPELEIIIVDAGKSSDGGYIVYRIRTGDIDVQRRYSEFSSLRAALVNLHPTLIIPPIPEKHSMADYAAKPRKAKEDTSIIDLRKRMLSVFLNRCRKMKEVVEDGSEVLHSPPVSSIPKSNLKAPPLDPANPSPAHSWLPVPSSSAKLKSASAVSETGTPSSPPSYSAMPSAAAHSIPGPQVFGRFPPTSQHLSEQELDPYFINFEASTRELEMLLQGNIERVNRRTLEHYAKLSTDLAELGARYNGFALSESSPTVAAAIERIGQAVDTTYLDTEELSANLGAGFAEPMRESAQFAGVVRSVLRYRVLKRVQQEMTRDELEKKKTLLDSLERSELEAKRIDRYLSNSMIAQSPPKRSTSSASARSNPERQAQGRREGSNEDAASIDSDFPPTHDGSPSSSPPLHRKTQSGNFVTNKIFGRISHAVHGFVDVDPERTRRDQIGKTKESLVQLEQALDVSAKDVKDASAGVLKDLKRFQKEKEDDLQRYMIAYARCHIDWARKNLETWTEAREEVDKIVAR
ncbi:Sorting nexin-41 [Endocarpon pusillum Z07020]|uniref:Sorting nexin-41 n=1 Tax=Endocarpon pusillum (strain Z07020 / HMAS-L-300199) TaxID=1263415 RepID=U1I1A3_ENDPU|nr:Sorting nexin-41 [Endocarpon pusillum Z07020]ERF75664.1 Sorting nexin-41 [Endocarpon pusillum Z07020]